jgi:hypothetical protein
MSIVLLYPHELFLFFCIAISFFLIFSMDQNGGPVKKKRKRQLENHPGANSSGTRAEDPNDEGKNKNDKKLCEEIRRALIKEIMKLANELPPEAPQRWSWAIREVSKNDGTNWKQLLGLHHEVFTQGRNSPFFNQVFSLMREVQNP